MIKSLKKCLLPTNTLSIEESIMKLKEVSSLLKQQISKYDTDYINTVNSLKTSIRNKQSKHAQIYLLKKSKLIKYHMESASKRLLSLDQQQLHLESIKMTALHLDAIRTSTKTLKSYMKQADIDKVEEMQDNLSELIAQSTDIQNILSDEMDNGIVMDESELEAELEELAQGDVELPQVPLSKLPLLNRVDSDDNDVSTPLIRNSRVESFV
jgi:charged multivesicular body protein 5